MSLEVVSSLSVDEVVDAFKTNNKDNILFTDDYGVDVVVKRRSHYSLDPVCNMCEERANIALLMRNNHNNFSINMIILKSDGTRVDILENSGNIVCAMCHFKNKGR